MNEHRFRNIESKISALPKVSLIEKPTPLQECINFSKALDGPRIFIKRDDLTGLAFGGNKSRMLELIIGEAKRREADSIVSCAYTQSNFDRQLAAAAAKNGMEFHFVAKSDPVKGKKIQGNLLLDFIFGAKVYLTESYKESVDAVANHIVENLRRVGKRPYRLNFIEVRELGTISYIECVIEIYKQSMQLRFAPDYIVCAAHAATQAGLILGCKTLGLKSKVIGFRDFKGNTESVINDIYEFSIRAREKLALETKITKDDIINIDKYGGEYGVMTTSVLDSIQMFARTEGIIADPVYVGKALTGLIKYIQKGKIRKNENVILIHTGGTPTIFSYNEDFVKLGDYRFSEGSLTPSGQCISEKKS